MGGTDAKAVATQEVVFEDGRRSAEVRVLSDEQRGWGHHTVYDGGWLRWQLRVNAFFLGLTDDYPPFRLSD